MTAYRFPGPVCSTRSCESLDDGTLARITTPFPGTSKFVPPVPLSTLRASGDCAFVNPVLSETVVAPAAAFTRLRLRSGAASISASEPVKQHPWPSGLITPAESQTVKIESQTFTVIRPIPDHAIGKNLPSTEQVAEALRAIPANQRRHTSRIILSPVPHPGSRGTSTIAGDASSHEITLYPVRRAQTQNSFDNRLMHEAGHNYQERLWANGAKAVAQWGIAILEDLRPPSPYASENSGEDFCEFLILFNAVRHTACEEVTRQMYPSRWAKMLEYESG